MIKPAFSCSSSYWFNTSSLLSVIVYAFVFNSFEVSSIRFLLWSHSCHSSNFSNFFLLNKCVKGQMYPGKSSEFVFVQFISNFAVVLCYSFYCLSSPSFKLNILMFHFATFWTSCEFYHPILPIDFWIVFDQPVMTQKHFCFI